MSKEFQNIYEVKKNSADVQDLKDDLKKMKNKDEFFMERISKIETEQALQGQKLDTIIRKQQETSRMIQNAIYGAVATGVIGGIIALIWAQIGVG